MTDEDKWREIARDFLRSAHMDMERDLADAIELAVDTAVCEARVKQARQTAEVLGLCQHTPDQRPGGQMICTKCGLVVADVADDEIPAAQVACIQADALAEFKERLRTWAVGNTEHAWGQPVIYCDGLLAWLDKEGGAT